MRYLLIYNFQELKLHPSATFIFEHHSLITVQPHITTTLINIVFYLHKFGNRCWWWNRRLVAYEMGEMSTSSKISWL